MMEKSNKYTQEQQMTPKYNKQYNKWHKCPGIVWPSINNGNIHT